MIQINTKKTIQSYYDDYVKYFDRYKDSIPHMWATVLDLLWGNVIPKNIVESPYHYIAKLAKLKYKTADIDQENQVALEYVIDKLDNIWQEAKNMNLSTELRIHSKTALFN